MRQREYFLDALRILAFGLLVLFHTGMYYVSWGFHVKSPFAGPALEPLMGMSSPWRMSLLFMISGAATAHMLGAGASWALVRQRSRTLLLPLLCGVVLVVPPQSYFEVVEKAGYAGSYLDFLGLYFTGYGGFCGPGFGRGDKACLILPTWNHLWFLPYLWLYTVLLCALLAWRPQLLQTASRRLANAPPWLALMVLPVLWMVLMRLGLHARFPSTYAVAGDWFNHSMYGFMMLAGAVLATAPAGSTGPSSHWERWAAFRLPALALALGAWAFWVGVRPTRPLEHLVLAVFAWCAIAAAFGYAWRYLNFDFPGRTTLTEAVFPIYILHQTIIILGSRVLLPLRLNPVLEGCLLVAATFLLSYLGYLLIRPWRLLRPWFGLRRR